MRNRDFQPVDYETTKVSLQFNFSLFQSPEMTEQKFRACLEDSVNEHGAHCPHTPAFSVTEGTEEKSSLLMSCLVSLPQDPAVKAGQ